MDDDEANRWLIWQLIDSAFPSGGFAHSGGLEAAVQAGIVTPSNTEGFVSFLIQYLELNGMGLEHNHSYLIHPFFVVYSSLPVVRSAHRRLAKGQQSSSSIAREMDSVTQATLVSSHVAQRGSTTMGLAFLSTCAKAFPNRGFEELKREYLVTSNQLHGHLAPIFGIVCCVLGIKERDAVHMFLFMALRNVLSSGIRLNVVGPLQAQTIQNELIPIAIRLLHKSAQEESSDEKMPVELIQTSPVFDVIQGTHDSLYSKLFNT